MRSFVTWGHSRSGPSWAEGTTAITAAQDQTKSGVQGNLPCASAGRHLPTKGKGVCPGQRFGVHLPDGSWGGNPSRFRRHQGSVVGRYAGAMVGTAACSRIVLFSGRWKFIFISNYFIPEGSNFIFSNLRSVESARSYGIQIAQTTVPTRQMAAI